MLSKIMLEFYLKIKQLFAVEKKKKKKKESTIKDVWQGSNHANIFSFSQKFFLRKSKKNKKHRTMLYQLYT